MLPLVGDLAPSRHRALALSVVVSGLLLGMLVARVLAGVLTQCTSWRTVYWLAFGLQYLMLLLLYLFMPAYPPTNPLPTFRAHLRTYPTVLWSIVRLLARHPTLVQACVQGLLTATTFTSFWTTLTFLLSSPPFSLSTIDIGLFALVGAAPLLLGPLTSRVLTDRFHPLPSVLAGLLLVLAGVLAGTLGVTLHPITASLGPPVVQAVAVDWGVQTTQIANRSAIYGLDPTARNRVNTAFMVSVFLGQICGTAIGNRLYEVWGWIGSGSTSLGFVGLAFLVAVLRGPREEGWLGWRGGWSLRRRDVARREGMPDAESECKKSGD